MRALARPAPDGASQFTPAASEVWAADAARNPALLARLRGVERRFAARLRALRFGAKERKAIMAVTPGAAARLLGRGRPFAAFLEQVEYSGRRLAKLDCAPEAVIAALEEYDRLLERRPGRPEPRETAILETLRERMRFSILLVLNQAYYQVRESEARAFFELAAAELGAKSESELIGRASEVLTRYCRAEAGRMFLFKPGAAPRPELSRPRHMRRQSRLFLDGSWRGRFASAWSVPFFSGRRLAGVLQFGFAKPYQWLPRELRLLGTAAEQALIAAEKARLIEEVARSERQVRELASHMLEVEEAERRRIRRELHDETGQMMLCLRLKLEMLEKEAAQAGAPFAPGLSEARRWAEQAITEIRRVLADLSPSALQELGLAAAVRQLAARFRSVYKVRVRLRIGAVQAAPEQTAAVAYRIIQECCNNAGRHSSASAVNISLSAADEVLRLRIGDNGVGFVVEEALRKKQSYGLAGMRERVALVGGNCSIGSRPGHGTVISVELPFQRNPNGDVCPKFEFC